MKFINIQKILIHYAIFSKWMIHHVKTHTCAQGWFKAWREEAEAENPVADLPNKCKLPSLMRGIEKKILNRVDHSILSSYRKEKDAGRGSHSFSNVFIFIFFRSQYNYILFSLPIPSSKPSHVHTLIQIHGVRISMWDYKIFISEISDHNSANLKTQPLDTD